MMGRGPTRDISPRMTFSSCGNSSRLKRRRKLPQAQQREYRLVDYGIGRAGERFGVDRGAQLRKPVRHADKDRIAVYGTEVGIVVNVVPCVGKVARALARAAHCILLTLGNGNDMPQRIDLLVVCPSDCVFVSAAEKEKLLVIRLA